MENKKKNCSDHIEQYSSLGDLPENPKTQPQKFSKNNKNEPTVYQADILQCQRATVSDDLSVRGRINADGIVKCTHLLSDFAEIPIIETVQVVRFENFSDVLLEPGDVVALKAGRHLCAEGSSRDQILLESVKRSDAGFHRLAGVVIGGVESSGKIGLETISPNRTGAVCIMGIVPLVKIESSNYQICEGEDLFAGPDFTAVPVSAGRNGSRSLPRLGFALSDAEENDAMVPVMVCGYIS